MIAAGTPASLPGATWRGPVHQVAPGALLIDVPGVGRALIRHGALARVDLAEGVTDRDARWLRDGPVAQAERLLHGKFALRATGVTIGGRAVALASIGAGGKSSVAAALASRGHAVLGDRELTLRLDAEAVTAVPSSPCLDLWPDVFANELGLTEADGELVRTELTKRRFAFQAGEASTLAVVVVLEPRGDIAGVLAEELRGADRAMQLLEHTVLSVLVDPVGLRAEHFAWGTSIAAATAVVRMGVSRHRRDLAREAAAVEELVA